MVSEEDLISDESLSESLIGLLTSGATAWTIIQEIESLHEQAQDAAKNLDDFADRNAALSVTRPELVRDLVLYFTFVSQVNEHLLSEAVYEHVIAEERKTDKMRELVHEMDPEYCLNILHNSKVIDDGLKGEVGQVKNVRNELMHELSERLVPTTDQDFTTQVERGYRSVRRLVDLALDFESES